MSQTGNSQGSFELQTAEGVALPRTPVWAMIPGVIVAAFVLDFIVPWLHRGTLPRFGLVLVAASLLFTAVMVCGFVVRAICARIVPGHRRLMTPIVRAACLTALWVPAWVLFMETWSLLMIAAGVICLMSLGFFLKQCDLETTAPASVDVLPDPGTPFMFDGVPLARVLLPSLLLVVLFDAAIALAANHWFVAASLAAGLFAGVLAWRAAARRMVMPVPVAVVPRAAISGGRQAGIVVAAFVFTVVALLPYLPVGPLRFKLRGPGSVAKTSGAAPNQSTASDGYSGIILLPLKEAEKKIIAPVKRELVPSFGVKIAEPIEIPFDGQYWYFKAPEKQPRPTARVVRGSSTKAQIRSTDRYPLLMEAHQNLDKPLDLGCCNAMDLVVENGDKLEGAIALELWVKKRPDPQSKIKSRVNAVAPELAPHYLGTVAIPSSELAISMRPNVSGKMAEERLRFPIPAAMDGTMFDEITVVVRPAPERAKAGAQIAIKKFVLEP